MNRKATIGLAAIWAAAWAALWPALAAGLNEPTMAVAAAAVLGVTSVLAWAPLAALLALARPRGHAPLLPAEPSDACAAGACPDCSGFLCSCRCHKQARQLAASTEYVIPPGAALPGEYPLPGPREYPPSGGLNEWT